MMNLFTASDIGRATGQDAPTVRAVLMARVRAGFLSAYVIVPMGETINSPNSIIAFEVATPKVAG